MGMGHGAWGALPMPGACRPKRSRVDSSHPYKDAVFFDIASTRATTFETSDHQKQLPSNLTSIELGLTEALR